MSVESGAHGWSDGPSFGVGSRKLRLEDRRFAAAPGCRRGRRRGRDGDELGAGRGGAGRDGTGREPSPEAGDDVLGPRAPKADRRAAVDRECGRAVSARRPPQPFLCEPGRLV